LGPLAPSSRLGAGSLGPRAAFLERGPPRRIHADSIAAQSRGRAYARPKRVPV